MKILDQVSALEELCKATKKWGMFISTNREDDYEEILKAAPYLAEGFHSNDGDDHTAQLLADGLGFILFDTEDEMMKIYYQTIGDDGPRDPYTNHYNGPAHVYALTCDPDGQTGHENT